MNPEDNLTPSAPDRPALKARIASFLVVRNAEYLVLAGMLFAVLAVGISEVHDFDAFWQLQSGRYMWETKSFIHTDLFTLAADAPRFEHCWLHDLIWYAAYSLAGYGGLSVAKGVLLSAAGIVLAWTALARGAAPWSVALLFAGYLQSASGWLERPQLWSYLLFALIVWILERYQRQPSWQVLWVFPAVVFWANVHAGSVLAVAVVCAYLVGNAVEAAWRKRFRSAGLEKLLAVLLLSLAAGLLTPYPSKLLNTLLTVANFGASVDSAGNVTGGAMAVFNMDWTPTTFQREPLFYYSLGIAAAIMLLGWRRLRLADICLMCGLALMGLKLVRHIPFFYFGAVAILPAYLDEALRPVLGWLHERLRVAARLALLCAAGALFWYCYQPLANVYGFFNAGLRTWHFPVEATEFVVQHRLPTNMYNTYDWGGYLAWKLYPDYLVFWDGRQDSAEMFTLGWQVMAGHPGWDRILDRFGVNTIVTRASTIDTGQKYPLLDELRKRSDWHLVFNSESSLVFVREGSVSRAWLLAYSRPKELMDDTLLSEAHLMVRYDPNRYMAWWGMSEIYLKRRQYNHALFALRQYISRVPNRDPNAENLLMSLTQQLQGQ